MKHLLLLSAVIFSACSNSPVSLLNNTDEDTLKHNHPKVNNLQLLQGVWIDRNDRNHEVIIKNNTWTELYADNIAAEYNMNLLDKPDYKRGKISEQGNYLHLQKDSHKIYYWQLLSIDTNYMEIEFLDAHRLYLFKKKSLDNKFDDCKCRLLVKAKNKAILRDTPNGDMVKKLSSGNEEFLIIASGNKWFQIDSGNEPYANLWIETKNLKLPFDINNEIPLYEEPVDEAAIRGYAAYEIELIKCCKNYIFVKAKNKKGAEQSGWIKLQQQDI
jgi:hypothetical protein